MSAPEYPFASQVKLVYSLCALHNIIMGSEQDPFFMEKVEEAIERNERRYRRRVATQDPHRYVQLPLIIILKQWGVCVTKSL